MRAAGARAGSEPGFEGGAGSALAFLRDALRAPVGRGELRMISLPAPRARPERLLRLDPSDNAVFWAGGSHSGADAGMVAGSGAAHVVTAAGADRFAEIRAAADALWPRLTTITHPRATSLPPRLFGGFSFLPGPPPAPWQPFGEGTFVLPRLLYSPAGLAPTLAVVAGGDDDPGAEALVRMVARVLERLAAAGPAIDPHATVPAAIVEETTQDAWGEAVASVRRRIAAGRAAKIVAARRTVLRLDAPPDPETVLMRLARPESPEIRFAIRRGTATLLGATPERLVSRRGLVLRTEALAGSIGTAAAGERDHAPELLASAKDAEEHALVVDAIAEALAPLCERLDHPARPRIQRLRHVLHLQTPFEGRLSRPLHVLELVERLHPTPAVGGTPTAEALDWIAAHEPAGRGWYAAPVGWFDADGDGDFVVALRSGLLDGDRAYLYAGAGIVRDSDPAAEYVETETKLKTMMSALGIAG